MLAPGGRPKDNVVQRLRDSHHQVARLAAAGVRCGEIARATGYSLNRISIYLNDPAFQELIAQYRKMVDEAFVENIDEYMQLATSNMVKAERMIADRLDDAEEEGEYPPIRELVTISRDAADRFGYSKKQTNINVNVDFAAKLEAAIKRSGKTVDLKAVEQRSPTLQPTGAQNSVSPSWQDSERSIQQPLKRRA